MKRMPTDFYKELHALRDKYGESEYHRDEILPATMALISKHLKGEKELLRDAANSILDSAEKSDDNAGGGMFPQNAHIALGEKKRIKRGAMNLGQLNRRKRVIDHNKTAQDKSWSEETAWINACSDALEGMPPETRVSEVLQDAAVAAE